MQERVERIALKIAGAVALAAMLAAGAFYAGIQIGAADEAEFATSERALDVDYYMEYRAGDATNGIGAEAYSAMLDLRRAKSNEWAAWNNATIAAAKIGVGYAIALQEYKPSVNSGGPVYTQALYYADGLLSKARLSNSPQPLPGGLDKVALPASAATYAAAMRAEIETAQEWRDYGLELQTYLPKVIHEQGQEIQRAAATFKRPTPTPAPDR